MTNNNLYLKLKNILKYRFLGTQYEWESHIENIFRILRKNLKNYIPNKLLDVGCANGDRTIQIANYFDMNFSDVYGIDFNNDFVSNCKKFFNAAVVDLETEILPYDNDIFDFVICNQVLEHLKNYSKVIDELTRVTKTKGYILIGIPNLAHLINRIYLLFGIQPMCIAMDSSHVRAFTHRSFVRMLDSLSEIRLLDVEGSIMYPLPLFLAKAFARHFVGLSGYVCYLLQKV
jgi:ubiquinone/menaquinone biosynthesis C-methylase UbiE